MTNNTQVFLLWLHIEYDDLSEKSKLLGVFSSEERCIKEKERIEKNVSIKEGQIEVSSSLLDKSFWVEGFFTE